MKNTLTILIPILLSIVVSITTIVVLDNFFAKDGQRVLSVEATPVPTPYAIYQIENLDNHNYEQSEIKLDEILSEEDNYTSYLFNYKFQPDLKSTKKLTGVVNMPNEDKKYPLVVMIRGYVDREIYSSGLGTSSGANFFANNDFITISPDFLGYGGSDVESFNVYEARFQTYTTLLSLLNSIDSLEKWDGENIFIWAHSNGGQIALTTLAATEEKIPTTLWAPVTKQFPYSVLYFTDELIDEGKYLRSELAKFEAVYDVDKFSFTNYLEQIKAPIQIHQGGLDDAVPEEWSREFAAKLDDAEVENELFIYPTADHNIRPNWNDAILRDLEFFLDNIK